MTPETSDEIHRRFWEKMEPGGEIDHLFKGATVQKRAAASDAEIELRKAQIAVMIDEYEAAIREAVAWSRQWKARQKQRGFRCVEQA